MVGNLENNTSIETKNFEFKEWDIIYDNKNNKIWYVKIDSNWTLRVKRDNKQKFKNGDYIKIKDKEFIYDSGTFHPINKLEGVTITFKVDTEDTSTEEQRE